MFLRLLPNDANLSALAEARLRFFHEKLGAGRCFIEAFTDERDEDLVKTRN